MVCHTVTVISCSGFFLFLGAHGFRDHFFLGRSGDSLVPPDQLGASMSPVKRVKNWLTVIPTTVRGLRFWLTKALFTPVLGPLLQERRILFLLLGVAAAQVWLAAVGIPGWHCPIKSSLGIACPGCGLSSAVALLIRGEWGNALSSHAFAPAFLLGFVLMMLVGMLPCRLHRMSVRWIYRWERRSGLTPLFLIGILVYWMLRSLGCFEH